MHLRNLRIVCLSLVFVAVGTSAVRAGNRSYSNVVIYTGQGAYGALGDARSSSNTVEVIGCRTYNQPGGTPYLYCYARDKQSNNASCISYDGNLVQTARAINGDSWIEFFYDTSGTCNYLVVDQASNNTPKTP